MGFVVEQHLNDSNVKHLERKDQALVYGKNEYMWDVSSYVLAFLIVNYSISVHQ